MKLPKLQPASLTTQLVHRLPSLAPHIQNAIDADSCIGEKTMKERFEKLISQPLEKMGSDPQNRLTMVVVSMLSTSATMKTILRPSLASCHKRSS